MFIIIILTIIITAIVTFMSTRSLYIHKFVDWYRTAIDYQSIDDEAQEQGEKMYKTLEQKHIDICKIDRTIIPDYVRKAFEWGECDMTDLYVKRLLRAARWLGYDLTLTKRPMDPPPPFKHPTPKNLKQELVECWEAEGRLMEQEKK